MPYKFNIFTGNFDLVNDDTGVQGPPSSTDNAITRWDGTSGNIVQDSKTVVQDGGAVEAQGFISRREITDLVVVPSKTAWITSAIELELTGAIELEPDAEIVIV